MNKIANVMFKIKKHHKPTLFQGESFFYVDCKHATGNKVMVIAKSIEKARPKIIDLLFWNNRQFWHDPAITEMIELLKGDKI